MMKKSVIQFAVASIFTIATAHASDTGGINYANQEQAPAVNSAPASDPYALNNQGTGTVQQQNPYAAQSPYNQTQQNPYTQQANPYATAQTTNCQPTGQSDAQGRQINQCVDQNGNQVLQTVETKQYKAPVDGQPASERYNQMGTTEKFWNIPSEQIKNIRKKYEEKQIALNQDVSPAQCVQSTIDITSAPGATIPLVRLDSHNIATIMMADAMGNPWTIDYANWNPTDITLLWDNKDNKASVLHVKSLNNYGQGNFVVKLADNPVPVVFSYANNQSKVDCMTVAKLDKAGPNSNISTQTINSAAIDSSLNSTLYGVAPAKSTPLQVSSNAAQAWLTEDGKVVLRTKYELLSPAYESVTRSPDGTYVYKSQYLPVFTYRYNDVISTFEVSK